MTQKRKTLKPKANIKTPGVDSSRACLGVVSSHALGVELHSNRLHRERKKANTGLEFSSFFYRQKVNIRYKGVRDSDKWRCANVLDGNSQLPFAKSFFLRFQPKLTFFVRAIFLLSAITTTPFLLTCSVYAENTSKTVTAEQMSLSPQESQIINEVANEYSLAGEARLLLFVIRKVENGRQGREFGVLSPAAQRFEDHPDWRVSFRCQAQWAAGTIKKRFAGDLKAFADRWCPVGAENDPTGLNKNWYGNAKYYMEKWRSEWN